jgi:hypothetical protein
MGHLLVQAILMLGEVCCCASNQLTLERQCRHLCLCGKGVGRVIVIFIFSQRAKRILHVGVGGSISLVARSGRCGIQCSLEHLLDHVAQLDPSLVHVGKEVPCFKSPEIQSGTKEKADRGEYLMHVGVWVLTQKGNLGAEMFCIDMK